MNIEYIPMITRAYASMIRMEMRTLEEFCAHGNAFFEKRMKKFEQELANEVPTDDAFIDLRDEMITHLEYNSYFGVVMAYAEFEHFLQHLHNLTLHVGTVPALREALVQRRQMFLKLEDYKDFFNAMGIQVTAPPFEWEKLMKLQTFRNTIAHQGGEVTEQNEKRLAHYGYKRNDYIKVTIAEVRQFIELVTTTAETLAQEYIRVLKEKKLVGREKTNPDKKK